MAFSFKFIFHAKLTRIFIGTSDCARYACPHAIPCMVFCRDIPHIEPGPVPSRISAKCPARCPDGLLTESGPTNIWHFDVEQIVE